jgi:HEAT repeat protein
MEKRIEALTKALKDEDENVRQAAASSIEKIENRMELEDLIKAFKSGDKVVKLRIIHAMRSIDDKRTFSVLLYSLKLPEPELRAAALDVLSQKKNPQVVPYIKEMLKDVNPVVQIQAARALTFFPSDDVTEVLCQMLSFSHGELLETIVESLGKLKNPDAEGYILDLMGDPDPRVRYKAAQALGELEFTDSEIPSGE